MGCLLSACQDCIFPNHAWEYRPVRAQARLVRTNMDAPWHSGRMLAHESGFALPDNQPGASIWPTQDQQNPVRVLTLTEAEVLDLATRVPWDRIIPRNTPDAVRLIIKFKDQIPDSAVQRCAYVPAYFKARYRYMR